MIRVFGDVALDIWLWGKPSRLAQEAPIPVMAMEQPPEISLGCAGNVASILAVNGIETELIGRVGEGYWGHAARELMHRLGIKFSGLIDEHPTTLKIRGGYVDDGRRIITSRWDHDRKPAPRPSELERVGPAAAMEPLDWKGIDALIVSDYDKDVVTRDARALLDMPGIPIIADMKWMPTRRRLPIHVNYALPNESEFYKRWNRRAGCPLFRETAQNFLWPSAYSVTDGIVVTMGRQGALYYDIASGKDQVVPQQVRPSADGWGLYPCGAGDAFTARFTVEILAGADIQRATVAAVEAASTAAITGVVEWETV